MVTKRLIFLVVFLLVAVRAGAVTPTPTATVTATSTATSTATATVSITPTSTPSPTPKSQTGYNPTADKYGYNWYTFATLPAAPGAGYSATLACLDCTKTNPAAQGVVNIPPILCQWANQWDCSGGLVWGRCLNLGTVTGNTVIYFNDSSCKVIATSTTGLIYVLNTLGLQQDENIELDSYINGSITGPIFIPSTGTIKWLTGVAPVSSTSSGNVDIIYLKWNGTSFVETGEALGVH